MEIFPQPDESCSLFIECAIKHRLINVPVIHRSDKDWVGKCHLFIFSFSLPIQKSISKVPGQQFAVKQELRFSSSAGGGGEEGLGFSWPQGEARGCPTMGTPP